MKSIKNILTIDVEDWYMVESDIATWNRYEDRIKLGMSRVLKILRDKEVKASFFVLGYIAENYPEIVRAIKEDGHEIGTHGYSHKPITKHTSSSFEDDIKKSIVALQNVIIDPIEGHRAAQFTVMKETSWAIDILKKLNIKYDSSIFPVKTHLYGVPDAPLFPYQVSSEDIIKDSKSGFWELPLSVFKMIYKSIPVAGGFYLRLFPYPLIKHAIKSINRQGYPAVVYLHPWELDVDQPRTNELPWYHYHNLDKVESRFNSLLDDFEFIPANEWLRERD